jgi:hypothetical protein
MRGRNGAAAIVVTRAMITIIANNVGEITPRGNRVSVVSLCYLRYLLFKLDFNASRPIWKIGLRRQNLPRSGATQNHEDFGRDGQVQAISVARMTLV